MKDNIYVITEENLTTVLEHLSKLQYKDVHVPMYILENVAKLEIEEPIENTTEEPETEELIEG